MIKFLLWLILLVVAWPLALLALILYPIVWLLSLPLRLLGISVRAIIELIEAVLRLPARVLKGPKRYRDPDSRRT
jgi:uncharacterized membrane protein YvlD (DUF360 family)